MPKFCANLSLLFKEYPMNERFERAAAAGFDAVEILFPYDQPAREIRDQITLHDLDLVLINCPPPNFTGGAPGYAAQPEQKERFRRDFARTLRYASVLNPVHIHIMAGASSHPDALDCFIHNLTWAVQQAPNQSLTIESLFPL